MIGKGIFTKDIYLFEKSVEPVLGAQIDPLRDYILRSYRLDKDKYKIKFNEFQKLIQSWVEFESNKKQIEEENATYRESLLYPERSSIVSSPDYHHSENEADDDFQYESKEKFKKIIHLKIERHFEKIKEIFQNYSDEHQTKLAQERLNLKPKIISEKPVSKKSQKSDKSAKSKKDEESERSSKKSEEEGEGEKDDQKSEKSASQLSNAIILPQETKKLETETTVKLSKMDKVLNDIAYLTGLGIVTLKESKADDPPKRSSVKGIDEFIHFIWHKKHNNALEEKRLTRGDKPSLKNKQKQKKDESEKNESSKENDEESDKKSEHNHPVKVGMNLIFLEG